MHLQAKLIWFFSVWMGCWNCAAGGKIPVLPTTPLTFNISFHGLCDARVVQNAAGVSELRMPLPASGIYCASRCAIITGILFNVRLLRKYQDEIARRYSPGCEIRIDSVPVIVVMFLIH